MIQTNSTRRVALITGGSKGLGALLAELLAGQGYDLVIDARTEAALLAQAAKLSRFGGRVQAIAGDLADPNHRAALAKAVQKLGGLDVLINNASTLGQTPLPALADYELAQLRGALEVNVVAQVGLIQMLLPYLKARRGLIVNLSSDAARGGYEGWGGYGAGKAALDLISLTLANELRADGVGVVSVDPGDLRTDMHQAAFPGEDISDRPLPEVTLPFWAWLFNQERMAVTGMRYQAQSDHWHTTTESEVTHEAV